MKKILSVLGLSFLILFLITGCGEKADETELQEASNLVQGLAMMGVMTDVDAYSGTSICSPPWGWEGPNVYKDLPEGDDTLYYQFLIKLPLDSMETTIDSLLWLVMLTPDIWAGDTGAVTKIDAWLIGETRTNIYFHTVINLPDTHVTGTMKWNWEETYYSYEYDVSTVTEAAEINITTSSNINLSAHFLFDDEGAGTTDDNWGKFGNTIFVRFEFFAEPDSNGYDGYYTLLSEDWKVKHYFVLTEPPSS